MNYVLQSAYQKAARFAAEQHANQTVPGSTANYMLHLSNVAMEVLTAHQQQPDFDLELAVQIALLHDVLEDTSVTQEELSGHFGSEVVRGVRALTKDGGLPSKTEQMQDSLDRIRQEVPEVAIVKMADRITNLQPPPGHWSAEKVANYRAEAQTILDALGTAHEYLAQRLQACIAQYGG